MQCVVSLPTEGTFISYPHPLEISIPVGACHTPPCTPSNFRNFPTWFGIPWKEYLRQKCRCNFLLRQKQLARDMDIYFRELHK